MSSQEIIVLAPAGRLDASGARPMEAELATRITAGQVHLVVDLTQVRYISSNGLRVLLVALKNAQKQNGALALCGLSPRLMEIFEMAGFDRVFQIFETREQARLSMNSSNQ